VFECQLPGGGAWVFGTIRKREKMTDAHYLLKVQVLREYMQELGITREMTQRPRNFVLLPETEIIIDSEYEME